MTHPTGGSMCSAYGWIAALALCIPTAYAAAQDGGGLYKERCAVCHDSARPHIPPRSALKAMTPAAVYTALTTGSMRGEAKGLSTAQLFQLIAYIGPTGASAPAPVITRTCHDDRPFPVRLRSEDWNGWSTSPTNSRFQEGAALTATDIPRLKLRWAFNLGAVAMTRGQPAVVGGRIFVATTQGLIYALDAHTGCTDWGFKTDGGMRSGVTLGELGRGLAVFFGDERANVYALDAATGKLIWKVHPATHVAATATATPRYYRGVLLQPFASGEEVLAAVPGYACCTFRGSLVALDARTGRVIWQRFTIAAAPHPLGARKPGTESFGPSGASIWSTPTVDVERGVVYVATGDNYSDPTTRTSDAVLAIDFKTGRLLWSHQLTAHDAYNIGCVTPQRTNCAKTAGPDFDFGQPPILAERSPHERVLLIAQKSGMAYGLDPDRSGALLWRRRVGRGSALGGSQWGSAFDGRRYFVAVSDVVVVSGVADPKSPLGMRLQLDPHAGGGLYALDPGTGRILWSAPRASCPAELTGCSPAQSAAVSAIPGVIFSGAMDGHLRAFRADTGETLWDFDTARAFETVNGGQAHGGALDAGGPAIAEGMVFTESGYSQWGGMPGNALLAFSVDGT